MKARLEAGDVIFVDNALRSEAHSYFRVLSVHGNCAYTRFRDFNRHIYPGGFVYEHGGDPNTLNRYLLIADPLEFQQGARKRGGCGCIFCSEVAQ